MGLSPPRWWCELKGGRAERRRQVENQGKTRRAGWRGGKRRGGDNFLVYRQQDRPELLRLREIDLQPQRTRNCVYDSKVKNSLTLWSAQACLDRILQFATVNLTLYHYGIYDFCTVNTQPRLQWVRVVCTGRDTATNIASEGHSVLVPLAWHEDKYYDWCFSTWPLYFQSQRLK